MSYGSYYNLINYLVNIDSITNNNNNSNNQSNLLKGNAYTSGKTGDT